MKSERLSGGYLQRKLVKYLGDLKEQGAPMTKKETIEASINVKSVQFVVFWYHGANCKAWLSKSLYFVSTKYLKQVWSEIEELSLKTIGLVVFHISTTKRETMRVATWTARMTNCPISVIEWSNWAFKLLWDLVRIIVTQVWTGHGGAVCGKIPPLCPFFAVHSLILFQLHAISLFGIFLCIRICILSLQ